MTSTSLRIPFDDPDADIIVRSSDDVKFRLYKVILAKASPVFRAMLQKCSDLAINSTILVVPLSEDARTLGNLFRLCYPVAPPELERLDEVFAVLRAAEKYEITDVLAPLQKTLREQTRKDPLCVYAIAYLLRFGDIARLAAKRLLEDVLTMPEIMPPEFDLLPSTAFYLLLSYTQKCVQASLTVADNHALQFTGPVWQCERCTTCKISSKPTQRVCSGSSIRRWTGWTSYVAGIKQDLVLCPGKRFASQCEPSCPAIQRAASICARCAPDAYDDCVQYPHFLQKVIDQSISKVGLIFPFEVVPVA
ncbi:hypothetical protein C8Q80DRAFT_879771 [Daedaleopsis nitida]|nr:hypothetical protein C8Q80DRAFT_879771 [Daedaleopsis nitida]